MIEIPRRSSICCKCQTPFVGGQPYFSAFREALRDERFDYCASCWSLKDVIFWKGVVPLKLEVPKRSVERALHFLKEALLEDDAPFALSLAISLMRKKALLLRQELELSYLFEVPETEEIFSVKKLPLTDELLQMSQKRLECEPPSSRL